MSASDPGRLPRLRLVLIGWGAIARRVAELVAKAGWPVDLVAVAVRDRALPRPGLPDGAALLDDPSHIAALTPDLVIEAAGRAAVAQWAPAALRAGPELVVASTSAFTDDALLAALLAEAARLGHRLTVPAGAIGGLDALAAASLLDLAEVTHRVIKPPAGWRGTAAEAIAELDRLAERIVLFRGPAREAAARYPQNANATVVTALAGLGLDRTEVELVADPSARGNAHEIEARGAFGRFAIRLDNRPLAGNPRSSELTALSLARIVLNRCGPLRIG